MKNKSIVVIAHNIRSLWNIGSFFRSADAFDISHMYLTGYTASPPRNEITKTALGAEAWIPWSKAKDPLPVIQERKKEGYNIISLEISQKSIPMDTHKPTGDICIILGHEILGVPSELQAVSNAVVHIPMLGQKHSLNVSVAAGIAFFHYRCRV